MQPTTRNHYNPCFWTAHWNDAYRRRILAREPSPGVARDQPVFVLNAKSGKIFETAVKNVHFDKHVGQAEITREAAEDFARRHYPDRYEAFLRTNATAPYPLYLDFENVFTGLEASEAYQTLLSVIRRQEIISAEEKAFLSAFIVIQHLRSHALLNAMLQWQDQIGQPRFEHLIMMKWMLSDADTFHELVKPIAYSHWTLFVAPQPCLPLCDSPILVSPESVMVALSPSLLLEILPRIPAGEHQCRLDDHLDARKLDSFRRRTIGNTFREIIFGQSDLLRRWQSSAEFTARHELVRDLKLYNRMVRSRPDGEVWLVNAFGQTE